jgi:signal transduction histidine kinase
MREFPPRPETGGLWGRLVAFDQRRPAVADALGAAVLAALSAPWLVEHNRDHLAGWICDVGLLLPLIWRRRWPAGVFMVVTAVALAQWLVGVPLWSDVALLVVVATVASERPRREAVAAWAVLEFGVVLASVRWSFTGSWVRSLIGLSGLAAVALLAGVVVRSRRAHFAELTERAVRLELERDQQAQIATAAERTRIAREMHDVIAHSLAVMIAMADGASAKLRREPERAGAAIDAVAEVGRQALGETRRLLAVLRDPAEGTDLAPQPRLDGLGELVDRVRDTGLDASLIVTGQPFALPESAELAVYRIVQEATTNVLKHAVGAGTVSVELRYDGTRVEVEVRDDGAVVPVGVGRHGGPGIEGMRERVALYHGTLHAGPGRSGGWVVRASLAAFAARPEAVAGHLR